MNTLISNTIENPNGISEECAQFTIDDTSKPFAMNGIISVGKRYTFGFWIKSNASGSVNVAGTKIQTTTNWERHVVKFTATITVLEILFNIVGTYNIYNAKLEDGDKDTVWTPAPEDMATGEEAENAQAAADEAKKEAEGIKERVNKAESLIQQLADSISMLVVDENGESLMEQTANGWTFSMSASNAAAEDLKKKLDDLNTELGSSKETIAALKGAMDDADEKLSYVQIGEFLDDSGEILPCIELGQSESDYKVLITNKSIMFRVGSNIPTEIDTDGIVTDNIKVRHELRHGNYVWMQRSNGHYSLMWKAVEE